MTNDLSATDYSPFAAADHRGLAIVGGNHLLPEGLLEDGGIYVRDGRIAAIGSRVEIETLIHAGDRIIDAAGDTVILATS